MNKMPWSLLTLSDFNNLDPLLIGSYSDCFAICCIENLNMKCNYIHYIIFLHISWAFNWLCRWILACTYNSLLPFDPYKLSVSLSQEFATFYKSSNQGRIKREKRGYDIRGYILRTRISKIVVHGLALGSKDGGISLGIMTIGEPSAEAAHFSEMH